MLEPYYQVMLSAMPEKPGTYKANFRVPQRLGIFRFVVDYMRQGLSFLNEQQEVSVIQWRHDAFPRFLTRAYPFYLSVFVLMAGFFILLTSFLFSGAKSPGASVASARDKQKSK